MESDIQQEVLRELEGFCDEMTREELERLDAMRRMLNSPHQSTRQVCEAELRRLIAKVMKRARLTH